ncbi:hypothetical protein POM88_007111 [Heracleum sosnowskyi]|uniref:Uncharacterized protein n=1 Tax=Heracleum sosnowskyi TaxID=360622 RepID=A0AAD8N784_9APIA|nr:hypothetical protein POM88_007111 [Heracleum sosnowskyi]
MNNYRDWMYQRIDSRGFLNPVFLDGLKIFMQYVISQPSSLDGTNIQCPYFKCENGRFWNADTVNMHLMKNGFVRDYYVWDRHGEPYVVRQSGEQSSTQGRRDDDNLMYNMVMDAAGPSFDPEMPNAEAQKLYDILKSSERDLYEGCETSQLSAMVQMLSLKSEHHWSETCYDQTSQFFKGILPPDNKFFDSFYHTKKYMEDLGLPSEKIDCCVNGCMIYWGEDINMESCKFCSQARYKARLNKSKKEKKKVPVKRMIYFPLAPRLQSDFPAYSMLSGWKTAGHLACPHCAHDHDAYNLSHGGKTTWFDNHRKFLHTNHPFRKNKNWFTKGKTVTESAPPVRTCEDVLEEIESLGLMKVTELGSDEHNARTKHRKVPRNDPSGGGESLGVNISIFSHPGRSHGSVSTRHLDDREYMAAHNYILFNCPEVAPYTEIFINQVRERNPYITSVEIDQCLESDFAMWFKHYAQNDSLVPNEYIRDLSFGPLRSVKFVPIYYVNGYKFHTREYGADKSTFNSGVCIKGSNYSETSNDYFGIIEEILIVEYPRLPIKKTVLFKCEWFDPTLNVGTRIHPCYNIVEVNKRKRLSVYEPFILAMQAMQVYFCNYPSLRRDKVDWLVVCKVKARAFVELPQIPTSHREPFQDDLPEHLSIISTNNIPAYLNDENGVEVDLDDDEGSPEEEIEYESEEDESSRTEDSNNCENDFDDSSD